MSTNSMLRCSVACGAIAGLLTACGGDETTNTEDHTPVRYVVLLDGQVSTAPFTFVAGEPTRLQLQFFNEADENLDDVESSHFGGVNFNPPSRTSVTRVADHNYQFDVSGNTPGAGTMTVSFGHDADANEHEFPAVEINVVPSGGGAF